jgi:carbonic anhydrase
MPIALCRGVLAAASLAIACGPAARAEAAHHWSYKGHTGPARWAALEREFRACGRGTEQSPIDIRSSSAQKAALPAIAFAYQPAPLRIIDNGHSIQVNYAPGSFITVGGHRYELQQFHFHKPSEEAIDGRHAAMVVHLVHRDAEGRQSVVAVLLQPGKVNPMVATLWNNLPARRATEVVLQDVAIDATDLLPIDRAYYTFAGHHATLQRRGDLVRAEARVGALQRRDRTLRARVPDERAPAAAAEHAQGAGQRLRRQQRQRRQRPPATKATKATIARMMNTKNRIFAMPIAPAAMPPKPKTAAISAMIKNTTA